MRLERLEAAVGNANGVSKHILNKPQRWVLAPHEIRTAKLRKAQLESWGFHWEYSPVDECILLSFSLLFLLLSFPFLNSFLYTLIVHQVPTLFDTKLTVHDFREFIAQLEESRGSSLTRPNAIGRILNHKACRGMHLSSHSLSPSLVPSLSLSSPPHLFFFFI